MADPQQTALSSEEITALGIEVPIASGQTALTPEEITTLGIELPGVDTVSAPVAAPIDPLLQAATQRPLSAAEQDRLASQAIRGITPPIQETVAQIAAIPGQIKRAFTGEERVTPETEALPEIGGIDFGAVETIKLAAKTLFTSDSQARIKFLKDIDPNIVVREDEKGNLFVTPTIGDTAGQEFVVNKPGFSVQDSIALAKDIAVFAPAAVLKTIGRVAVATGLTDVAQQLGAKLVGSQEEFDIFRTGLIALTGGFGKFIEPSFIRLTDKASAIVNTAKANREIRQLTKLTKLEEREAIVEAGKAFDVNIRTTDVFDDPISRQIKKAADRGGVTGGDIARNQKAQFDDAVDELIAEQQLGSGSITKREQGQDLIDVQTEISLAAAQARRTFTTAEQNTQTAEFINRSGVTEVELQTDEIFENLFDIVQTIASNPNTPSTNLMLQAIADEIALVRNVASKIKTADTLTESLKIIKSEVQGNIDKVKAVLLNMKQKAPLTSEKLADDFFSGRLAASQRNAQQLTKLKDIVKNPRATKEIKKIAKQTIAAMEGRLERASSPMLAAQIIITDIESVIDDSLSGVLKAFGSEGRPAAETLRNEVTRLLNQVDDVLKLDPLAIQTKNLVRDQVKLAMDNLGLPTANKKRVLDAFNEKYDILIAENALLPENETAQAFNALTNIKKEIDKLLPQAKKIDLQRSNLRKAVAEPAKAQLKAEVELGAISSINAELNTISQSAKISKGFLIFDERLATARADLLSLFNKQRTAIQQSGFKSNATRTLNALPKENKDAIRKILLDDFLKTVDLTNIKIANAELKKFIDGPAGVLFKGAEGGKLKGMQRLLQIVTKTGKSKLNRTLRESDSFLNSALTGGTLAFLLGKGAIATGGIGIAAVSALLRVPRLYESKAIRNILLKLARVKNSNALDVAANELIPKLTKIIVNAAKVAAKPQVGAALAEQINTTNDNEENK